MADWPTASSSTTTSIPRSDCASAFDSSSAGFQFSVVPPPRLLCCVWRRGDFAAYHDRFDISRILGSPLAKRSQRLSQGSPESREGIFDLRGYLSEIDTIDDPVRLQLLELLNQHFVTDVADRAS